MAKKNEYRPNYHEIHPDFKWNGTRYSKTSLVSLAQVYQSSAEKYKRDIGVFLMHWFSEDPLVSVQTSGSTGEPKTIRVKKEYMINSCLATQKFFKLPEKTLALLCLPATYIAGKLMLVRAIVLGWHLDAVEPRANPLKSCQKTYDFCAMTPFQLNHSLAELHKVKKIIVGGGALSDSLLAKIQNRNPEIFESYGMTETLTHIAVRKINDLPTAEKPPFQVLEHVEIQQDKRGCLVIKAPKVADSIIVTNDLVDLVSPTEFHLRGRFDTVINSGGIKIIPEEVEKKLGELISSRFFVAGIPDDVLGEKLILLIETSEKSMAFKNKMENSIRRLKSLSLYERPKEIYTCSKFAETHSGKIKRKATLERVQKK